MSYLHSLEHGIDSDDFEAELGQGHIFNSVGPVVAFNDALNLWDWDFGFPQTITAIPLSEGQLPNQITTYEDPPLGNGRSQDQNSPASEMVPSAPNADNFEYSAYPQSSHNEELKTASVVSSATPASSYLEDIEAKLSPSPNVVAPTYLGEYPDDMFGALTNFMDPTGVLLCNPAFDQTFESGYLWEPSFPELLADELWLEELLESAVPVPGKNKRKRFDSEEREKVKQVRRSGACLRCRIYRMKCDLGMPCQNCLKVQDTAKIFKQPCYRLMLKDVVPFRVGNSRTGHVKSVLPEFSWSFDFTELHKISITPLFAGVDHSKSPSCVVRCRRFIPSATDVLIDSYEAPNGEIMTIEFPPYACFDAHTASMQKAIDKYLDECQPFAEIGLDRGIKDEILALGFKEARRFSKTRDTIVSSALKIQSAVHVAESQPVIVGGDTLGIEVVNNEKYKEHGNRPIPIALDFQLDNLYIRYMQKNLKVVLKGLSKLIFARKNSKENWYEIFLTILILLSTLEGVFEMQIRFVQKYSEGDDTVLETLSYVKRQMIAEWQASAKNLIYHFRCVLKAMIPFSHALTPEMQKQAMLDVEAVAFIHRMTKIIAERRKEIAELCETDLNNNEARPLVWISQLFLDD